MAVESRRRWQGGTTKQPHDNETSPAKAGLLGLRRGLRPSLIGSKQVACGSAMRVGHHKVAFGLKQ